MLSDFITAVRSLLIRLVMAVLSFFSFSYLPPNFDFISVSVHTVKGGRDSLEHAKKAADFFFSSPTFDRI